MVRSSDGTILQLGVSKVQFLASLGLGKNLQMLAQLTISTAGTSLKSIPHEDCTHSYIIPGFHRISTVRCGPRPAVNLFHRLSICVLGDCELYSWPQRRLCLSASGCLLSR